MKSGESSGTSTFQSRWRQKTLLGGLAHLSEKQAGTPGEHQSQKSSQESFTKERSRNHLSEFSSVLVNARLPWIHSPRRQ